MAKITKILEVVVFGVFLMGVAVIAEEITLTTYYPAPYGAYNELSTTDDTYLATDAAGKVGIGTTEPKSKLDVEGGVAIGVAYSGTSEAPANGMIIEGRVGIGTTSPAAGIELDVNGTVNATGYSADGTEGYTGDLKDSNNNKIADVKNGIITAVYY